LNKATKHTKYAIIDSGTNTGGKKGFFSQRSDVKQSKNAVPIVVSQT